MLGKFKQKAQMIDEVEEEEAEPIDKKTMEEAIKLIEVANEIGCDFQVCFRLTIDEFTVTSGSFKGIKLISSKKEGDKVLIQYSNMLFSSDTYIDLDKITKVAIKCEYTSDKGEVNV